MVTPISVPEAARRLGCSPVTARKLVTRGEIDATPVIRGSRTFLRVDPRSVDTYLTAHGPYGGNGTTATELRTLRREIQELRDSLGQRDTSNVDDLRAQVVTLTETVRLQREIMSLQNEADDARSEMTDLLAKALHAGAKADARRREVLRAVDSIVGQFVTPGHSAPLDRQP